MSSHVKCHKGFRRFSGGLGPKRHGPESLVLYCSVVNGPTPWQLKSWDNWSSISYLIDGILFAVWWTILHRGPGWKWVPLWLLDFHDHPSTLPPHLPGYGRPAVGLSSWLYSAALVESPHEADGGTASTAWTVQCCSCGKEDQDDKDWKVQGIESSPSWHINVLWLVRTLQLLPTIWCHSEPAQGMTKRENSDVGCRARMSSARDGGFTARVSCGRDNHKPPSEMETAHETFGQRKAKRRKKEMRLGLRRNVSKEKRRSLVMFWKPQRRRGPETHQLSQRTASTNLWVNWVDTHYHVSHPLWIWDKGGIRTTLPCHCFIPKWHTMRVDLTRCWMKSWSWPIRKAHSELIYSTVTSCIVISFKWLVPSSFDHVSWAF